MTTQFILVNHRATNMTKWKKITVGANNLLYEYLAEKNSTFLSYGGGLQTFAILILIEKGKVRADEVIFADTGAEHSETYEHIENVVKPICERIGVDFTVVRMAKQVKDRITKEMKVAHSLTETIEIRGRIPSLRNRWCTEYSKIVPIKHYIREKQAKRAYVKPATALIGISLDEWQRMHKPHLSEYVTSYPLIEMRMTRQDCIELIRKSGYPLPPKSGCYFCPFQGPQQWRKLYETERDKFNYAMQLEERDPKFPTYTLARDKKGPLPLRKMSARFGEGSKDLTEFDIELNEEMSCEQGGYCHI